MDKLYLKNKNTKPIIKVIDEGDSENINELEIKWIKYYRDNGIELLNETDGGDGCLYFKGKKLSKEHIDKI